MLSLFTTIFLYVLALSCMVATALPILHSGKWLIRIFDFPRAQIFLFAIISVLGLAFRLFLLTFSESQTLLVSTLLLLIVSAMYQAYCMLPYTPMVAPEVPNASGVVGDSQRERAAFKVLVANLQFNNKDHDKFLELVRSMRPNLMLLTELDQAWANSISGLHEQFPHRVEEVRDNGYGIALYSSFTIRDGDVNFLVTDSRPSVHAVLAPENLDIGIPIRIWGLHPAPPGIKMSDSERKDSRPRDAELLILGRKLKDENLPTMVLGDLNDTGWSRTTALFKKLSGMKDPRVGRGFYNTYHTEYPVLRYPIDHVFVSSHFELLEMVRLESFGSDHFPVFASFTLKEDLDFSSSALADTSEVNDSQEVSEELEDEVTEVIAKGQKQANEYSGKNEVPPGAD